MKTYSKPKFMRRMKTSEECLKMLEIASQCPDVALSETIHLIQLDAFNAGCVRLHEAKALLRAAPLYGLTESSKTWFDKRDIFLKL